MPVSAMERCQDVLQTKFSIRFRWVGVCVGGWQLPHRIRTLSPTHTDAMPHCTVDERLSRVRDVLVHLFGYNYLGAVNFQ